MAETSNQQYKVRFAGEWDHDSYIESCECANCGNKCQVLIRSGVPKRTIEPFECSRCGCKTMKVL